MSKIGRIWVKTSIRYVELKLNKMTAIFVCKHMHLELIFVILETHR